MSALCGMLQEISFCEIIEGRYQRVGERDEITFFGVYKSDAQRRGRIFFAIY
jgi:hypothetical protein